MNSKQLIMFEETKEEILEQRINTLEQQLDRIRKSLFGKYSEMMQLYLEQKNNLDSFKETLIKT